MQETCNETRKRRDKQSRKYEAVTSAKFIFADCFGEECNYRERSE